MTVFGLTIDAIFADPHIARDAVWRVGGGTEGVPVRVIEKSPEAIVMLGDNRFDLNAMLLDVRISEVAEPRRGDQVDLLGDDGVVAGTVLLTGLSTIDSSKLVRTCEVSPLAEDDPDEENP